MRRGEIRWVDLDPARGVESDRRDLADLDEARGSTLLSDRNHPRSPTPREMAAARAHRLPRDRIVIEILARTGLRASELSDLAADAVTKISDAHWLRVPVGKLRNNRFIPLHPDLVELLAAWTADNIDHMRATGRFLADTHSRMRVPQRRGRFARRRGRPTGAGGRSGSR
jgi:integrase